MNAKEKIEELLEASEDGTITAAQVTEAGLPPRQRASPTTRVPADPGRFSANLTGAAAFSGSCALLFKKWAKVTEKTLLLTGILLY